MSWLDYDLELTRLKYEEALDPYNDRDEIDLIWLDRFLESSEEQSREIIRRIKF